MGRVLEVSVATKGPDSTKRRLVHGESLFDVFEVLCALLPAPRVREWGECHIKILEAPGMQVLAVKPLNFTNICGKLTHHHAWSGRAVHVPAVEQWIVVDENSFGPCRKLCSPYSTLMTCMQSSVTRFCGGVSFVKTCEVISIAIDPESVAQSTLHMVVANEHMGRPINTGSPQLLRALQADGRWAAQCTHEYEDVTFVVGFMLSGFDLSVMRFASGLAMEFSPTTVRVMVSRRGKVNYFVSLSSVPLDRHVDVEREVAYVLGEVGAVLWACT